MNTLINPEPNRGKIPILLVYVSTISQLFVIFVAVAGVFISLMAGNSLWRMVIQVALATLVAGVCAWGVNMMIAHSLLEATLEKMKIEAEKEAEEAAIRAAAAAEAAAAAAAAEAAAEAAAAEEFARNYDNFEPEIQL